MIVGPSEDGDTYQGLPEGCTVTGPVDGKLCLPCGNGTCDPDEGYCNCPDDCTREE